MTFRVFPGDGERRERDVGGDDATVRQLARERHRDAAASGADVGKPQLVGRVDPGAAGPRGEQTQRLLHDQLGLGARDEDGRRDTKLEPPELLRADDVGGRLVARAPRQPVVQPRFQLRRDALGLGGDDPRPVPVQDGADEQVDVDGRFGRRHAGRDEARPACGHDLVKRHLVGSDPLDPVASLSFWAL